jgi:hypothetical protein
MENLPLYLHLGFGAVTFFSVFLFYKATHRSKAALLIMMGWLLLQAIIGLPGFYTVTNTIPPRFLLLVVPPLLLIVFLFINNKGRSYIDSLDVKTLTLLHVVRMPVELVLLGLFTYGTIPQLMTFEGRNFDILSGLTAPLTWYFGYVKQKLSKRVLIAWNLACLGLLINIVTNAVLAAPFPFQKFAFDQPNIAVLYFPYVWLPCCIVPLVLFSHLVSLRHLLKNETVPAKTLTKQFQQEITI